MIFVDTSARITTVSSHRAELGRYGGLARQESARKAGIPLEDVQDAAGHVDPHTTPRYDRGRHSLDRHASYAVTSWLDPVKQSSDGIAVTDGSAV